MEIILLEKIQNLGDIGTVVKVKNGYARNFLIPQNKAMIATGAAKSKIEEKRKQLAEGEAARLQAARQRSDAVVKHLVLKRQTSEDGRLYGSVATVDIVEAFAQHDCQIEKSEIVQSDGVIKQVGESEIEVILHPEVCFSVKIVVESENWDTIQSKAESVVSD